MKVSVVIISKTEKINDKVAASVAFAEEIIIIVDSPAKKPRKIGKKYFYYRPLADNYSAQRNFALTKAHEDWVLFVDGDEYVGTELQREIQLLDTNTKHQGFFLRRIDVCFHQRLLHGETGYTKLLRLARKTSGNFVRPVHEVWKIKGEVGELSSPLYHIKDSFISNFIDRMARYANIDADILTKEGKPFSYWRLFLNPKAKFILNYKLRLGFLDGTVGLFQAYLMSIQSLTVRIFQWTKRN